MRKKKDFFLSQTAKKHFAKVKWWMHHRKKNFDLSQTMLNKKTFCESEQHRMKFFALFQTMIKSFWESESDKCIAETLLLQSVPHCTATAAPQLIRRRRKKKIARIDPIPIDRTPKSYFPDFKKKFSFHFPFVGLIKVLCCVFLSKSSFMFPFHVNRELQNPRIYSRGGNSCGFRDTDKYLQQENIFSQTNILWSCMPLFVGQLFRSLVFLVLNHSAYLTHSE